MISELVSCFERTLAFVRVSVADLSDEGFVPQPPGVPNHAAWTLGHVIHSCQAIAGEPGVEPWRHDPMSSSDSDGELPDWKGH